MKTQSQIVSALKWFVVTITLFAITSAKAADTNGPTANLLFIGMTPGQYAGFILTNGTSAHIACVPQAIEYQTNNVWKKIVLLNKPNLTRKWTAPPEELQPGEAKSFAVPPPVTNSNWRLVFYCVEHRTIVDTAYDTVRHLRATNSVQQSSQQFSGRHYSITSPVVTNQLAAPSH